MFPFNSKLKNFFAVSGNSDKNVKSMFYVYFGLQKIDLLLHTSTGDQSLLHWHVEAPPPTKRWLHVYVIIVPALY